MSEEVSTPFRLYFLVFKEDEIDYIFPKSALKAAYDASTIKNKPPFEDMLKGMFPLWSGEWEWIQPVSPFTGAKDRAVENQIKSFQPDGTTIRNAELFDQTLVEVAVTKWSFSPEVSAEEFLNMPFSISGTIANELMGYCYPNMSRHKGFLLLNKKPSKTS